MSQPVSLAGKKVLVLIASGFEETELTGCQRALMKAGASMKTASVDSGLANGWHGNTWGHYHTIDLPVGETLASDFDCLLLPGGTRSIAKLKQSAHSRRIINTFMDGGKPVAAISQALELLALAGSRLSGRTVTGPADLKGPVETLGALWSETPVAADRNLVTTPGGAAMEAFMPAMLSVFAAGPVAMAEAE
ncbi:MAG: DJ-1/PfpI family protein [Pseudomonadota bacterium]|nr:DJ-1/PfpI family protein [Pseudomonadota bacterium]